MTLTANADAEAADASDPVDADDAPAVTFEATETTGASGDALWDAVTWYAFLDGLMARTDGVEHVKGAYTILARGGLEGQKTAFTGDRGAKDPLNAVK